MTVIGLFKHAKDFQIFNAGDIIFSEGETGEVMYVVIEGEVELEVHQKDVEVVGQGSILGEMALIDKHPRSATARAKTEAKLVPIDQKRFTFLVQETPLFALQVMQIMADRLRRMDAQL